MDETKTWRKSTRSASQSNCVEVACTLDALRDSKSPTGPMLSIANLTESIEAIKESSWRRLR